MEKYLPPKDKPLALIVDVDGTLAKKGDRDVYDGAKTYLDTPIKPIIEIVRRYSFTHKIIIVSGRKSETADVVKITKDWLEKYDIPFDELFIRIPGDNRQDAIIKKEIFDSHIRHNYDISFILEDRNRVVDMWRSLGLTCLQVANGDF